MNSFASEKHGKALKKHSAVESLQFLEHPRESSGQRSKSRRTKNRDAEQHKRNASACAPCVRRQSSFATPRTRMRSDLLDFSHLLLKTFANNALLRPGYTPNCREHVLVATRNTLGASKKLYNIPQTWSCDTCGSNPKLVKQLEFCVRLDD